MLADDHPLARLAVRKVLELAEFEVVAEAQSGGQVLPLVHQTNPELLLLDVWMPEIDGLRLLEHLRRRHPELSVVILSGDASSESIAAALRLGARAYLIKTFDITELPAILRELEGGRVYIPPPSWAEREPDDVGQRSRLTRKELEVLGLLVEGYSNPDIAARLWLSRETVKTHLSHIYRKLDVTGRTQACKRALELGLIVHLPRLDAAPATRAKRSNGDSAA
jgi:DNA-binding NarL/FixJ family response regulator